MRDVCVVLTGCTKHGINYLGISAISSKVPLFSTAQNYLAEKTLIGHMWSIP